MMDKLGINISLAYYNMSLLQLTTRDMLTN